MKVVFSTEAKGGLREIAPFIARDNKVRALSFVRELRVKAQQLGDMPYGFPLIPRHEHHGTLRRPLGEYLIFYRVEADQLPSSIFVMGRAITRRCSSGRLRVLGGYCALVRSPRADFGRDLSLRRGL